MSRPPRRRHRVFPLATLGPALALVATLGVAPAPSAAELVGPPFPLAPESERSQIDPDVTSVPHGGFAVVWWELDENLGQPVDGEGLYLGRLGPDGDPIGAPDLFATPGDEEIVALPRVSSQRFRSAQVYYARSAFDFQTATVEQAFEGDVSSFPDDPQGTILECGVDAERLSALDAVSVRPDEAPRGTLTGNYAAGACEGLAGTELRLAWSFAQGVDGSTSVALEPIREVALAVAPRGQALVVWITGESPFQVRARLFDPQDPDDAPGPERVLGGAVPGSGLDAVALDGVGGGFAVAWRRPALGTPLPDDGAIAVQRLTPDGIPRGPARAVSGPILTNPEIPDDALGPALATGPGGRFAALWVEPALAVGERDLLMLQTFAFDGGPVGARTLVSPHPTAGGSDDSRITSPRLAWDTWGTNLLAVWRSTPTTVPLAADRLVGQLVDGLATAAPRDELCAYAGSLLRCVTGTVRVDPRLLAVRFGTGGDTPLLTDLDGDGRHELCLSIRGTIRCDLAMDGFQAELIRQTPLRTPDVFGGDLSPNPPGDVCYRPVLDTSRVFCRPGPGVDDTPSSLFFGRRDQRPILGDSDGDGRDELCLVLGGQLRCDTARDGGAAELVRPVPQLLLDRLADGATPLLADIDGSGQDELCVAFADRFQCDVVGLGLREIPIPGGVDFDAGDTPLVGNVDGL